MFGKFDLTGLGRARDGEFQPTRVGEIPVGHRANRVHLLHGASYDSPDGTPVACLLLRYKDDSVRRFFISYGVHVRNWYVERNETVHDLSDPRSRVVWTGSTRADGSGTPTRLFMSTFDNPRPEQEIRGLEFLSLFARANPIILAITLEDAPDAKSSPGPADELNESQFRREAFLRVKDADSGQPVPEAAVRLRVTEGTRHYGFGGYTSDARGEIRIDYPPGKFEILTVDMTAPGYPPVNFTISAKEGVFGPDLPVRLKRE